LLKKLVRPEGLEPPAYWFEANRSIQLSYGRGSGVAISWYHCMGGRIASRRCAP
jgi:hypothetical protein